MEIKKVKSNTKNIKEAQYYVILLEKQYNQTHNTRHLLRLKQQKQHLNKILREATEKQRIKQGEPLWNTTLL